MPQSRVTPGFLFSDEIFSGSPMSSQRASKSALKAESSRSASCSSRYACVLVSSVLLTLCLCGGGLIIRLLYMDHSGCNTEDPCPGFQEPKYESLESEQCRRPCETKECLKTAAYLLQNMDPAADPCQDFYRFSCGNYHNLVLGEKEREIPLLSMTEDIFKDLKSIIEDIPRSIPEGEPGSSFVKIRRIYDSCINSRSREETVVPTVRKYFAKFGIPNWPHLDQNFQYQESLEKMLAIFFSYHRYSFFTLDTEEKDSGSDNNVSQSNGVREMEFKLRHLYSTIFRSDHQEFEKEAAMAKGKKIYEYFDLSDEESSIILEDIINFDEKLYNITKPANERTSECYDRPSDECQPHNISCSSENSTYSKRWCSVLLMIEDCLSMTYPNESLNFLIPDKVFFEQLGDLLDNTAPRVIAHALALKFIMDEADATLTFYFRGFSGTAELDSLWKECIHHLVMLAPAVLGTRYYHAKYHDVLKNEIQGIFRDIKESSISLVRNSTWLDEEQKTTIITTLEEIRITSDLLMEAFSNISRMDEYLEQLIVSDDSYLANALELEKILITFVMKSNLFHYIFGQNPFEINPAYGDGVVYISLGYYLFPVIEANRPRYINLGSYGSTLGHEFGHAVEQMIRMFTERSESSERPERPESSESPENFEISEGFKNSFQEKFDCFSEHYGEFEITGIDMMVNGSFTFYENMADMIGNQLAFMALKNYLEIHGIEERLPGMDFSNEQMMYLSIAQFYCEVNKMEALLKYKTDMHSPSNVRVLAAFRNNEDFAEAFNCPVGSFMNPAEKCRFLP